MAKTICTAPKHVSPFGRVNTIYPLANLRIREKRNTKHENHNGRNVCSTQSEFCERWMPAFEIFTIFFRFKRFAHLRCDEVGARSTLYWLGINQCRRENEFRRKSSFFLLSCIVDQCFFCIFAIYVTFEASLKDVFLGCYHLFVNESAFTNDVGPFRFSWCAFFKSSAA